MQIHKNENRGCSVRVKIAKQVTTVHISHNVLNRRKRVVDMWCVVHRLKKFQIQFEEQKTIQPASQNSQL